MEAVEGCRRLVGPSEKVEGFSEVVPVERGTRTFKGPIENEGGERCSVHAATARSSIGEFEPDLSQVAELT
jgi:hypothetical protein